MDLIKNEKALLVSNNDNFILTNFKVSLNHSSWFEDNYIAIFLEDISFIQRKRSSNLYYILFSLISLIIVIIIGEKHQYVNEVGIFLILGFLYSWWLSKKNVITIISNSGSKLELNVRDMTQKNIDNFIHELLIAKNNRKNEKLI